MLWKERLKDVLPICEMNAMITFVRAFRRSSVRKTAAGMQRSKPFAGLKAGPSRVFRAEPDPSEVPTTTEAQPVVIVRYIKASLEVSLPLPPLVRRPPGIGLSHLMPVWLLFALHLLVLLLLQVFVQVFVVAVKNGLVDHFGRG